MEPLTFFVLIVSLLSLLVSVLSALSVLRKPQGSKKMIEIGQAIREGAEAFLKRQYSTIFIFVIAISVLLFKALGLRAFLAYICGSSLSLLAGYLGMWIAIRGNTRTAQASLSGLNEALGVAFRSGLVMGTLVAGFGLLGLFALYSWIGDPKELLPFSFGASSVAVFARVGGGIYTKTADIGADLVGKVEAGIPEDDPRNPAVIADNVGDNVGDVAGMGSDLFESFVAQIVATMIVGSLLADKYVFLPLVFAAFGTLSSLLVIPLVRVRGRKDPSYVLNSASIGAMILTAVCVFLFYRYCFPDETMKLFVPSVLGIVSGMIVGLVSDYFTNRLHAPARFVARSSLSGAAVNILSGYSVGLLSSVIPVVSIAGALVVAYHINGLYGVCLAGMGMLSVTAIIVSVDAYGPVADNAGGIIEQAGLKERREITDALDSVGNTTKAISKGFAIGSAVLTSISLFISYASTAGLTTLDFLRPETLAGAFVGASVVTLFCALIILGVSRNAFRMVEEVRRQFREIPGLMEGKSKPDYQRCVDIATKGALKELVLPATIILVSPLLVGVFLGRAAVGGMLVGGTLMGAIFALLMANAGAAWDNAKKFIELGNLGGKGTPAHQAAVVGDTVGDPLKDASGPSINIAIKLMSMVSLLIIVAGVI